MSVSPSGLCRRRLEGSHLSSGSEPVEFKASQATWASRVSACEWSGSRDGVYAVIESAEYEKEADINVRSELLRPIRIQVDLDDDGTVIKRYLHLADTEAFVGPCCVVPDIGGPSNRYFSVLSRESWAAELLKWWVMEPHNLDAMDPLDSDNQVCYVDDTSSDNSMQ